MIVRPHEDYYWQGVVFDGHDIKNKAQTEACQVQTIQQQTHDRKWYAYCQKVNECAVVYREGIEVK